MSSPHHVNLDGATVLVTGGAGFVGSALALSVKRDHPGAKVIVVDNLRRAGSELRPPVLGSAGIEFVRGDIRNPDDLTLGKRPIDLIIECSAEPSVLAGYGESPRYVIETNLVGTMNCLELARERKARVLFLSTSRVYPTSLVNRLEFAEEPTRFTLRDRQPIPGASGAGINESFPLGGARTFYGMTKLASEMLLEEYAAGYGLDFVTLRFGVISGPGQMGKVEQGVFALWMARHLWGTSLTYKGWGGTGKQVRDVLHIDDAVDLARVVTQRWDALRGQTLNAGGGSSTSASLLEATAVCQSITGRTLTLDHKSETHPTDVRIFVTDHSALTKVVGWRPTRGVQQVFSDLYEWMRADESRLKPILAA
ncbi:MAG TPA: NAD-dependent epimerase/dehydratase family protein [Gemmatimonadaceae bacterium]